MSGAAVDLLVRSSFFLIGLALGVIWTEDARGDVLAEALAPDDYQVLSDPSFARVDVAQAFAEASLTTGIFRKRAEADGTTLPPNSVPLVRATSQLNAFRLTNTGSNSICFGGAPGACAAGAWYPFEVEIDANFSRQVGPAAGEYQIWRYALVSDVRASIVNIFGTVEASPSAGLSYLAAEEWRFGSRVGDVTFFNVDGGGSNGGTVRFDRRTLGELEATLVMPAIVLDPGERMAVNFFVYVEAEAFGPGFRATADMSNTARIRLALPANATYSTNAPTPPAWITLPEPGFGPTLFLGGLALARARRSRPRRH
ncbi:hypothetical protein K2X89_12040 [Myxococcota bacterium]|nr:hypothetical protein [Myxococcota bacterium]